MNATFTNVGRIPRAGVLGTAVGGVVLTMAILTSSVLYAQYSNAFLIDSDEIPASFSSTTYLSAGLTQELGDDLSVPPVPQVSTESSSSSLQDDTAVSTDEPLFNPDDYLTKSEFQDHASKLAWKKGDFTFTPYGFVWVNAVMNSQACVTDCFLLYNQSPDQNDAASCGVDARTSRIGMKIDGPKVCGIYDLSGTFEADFQGAANGSRNKGQMQFRKAYIELIDKANDARLEFGQDWDTISPLAPQMLNYLPCGFVGNIGYRRAQIRYEKGFTFSPDFKSKYTIGIADPFPGDFLTTPGVSACSGGWPMVQGRVAFSFGEHCHCGRATTIGFSGHIGQNVYQFSGVTARTPTWSYNADLDIPIGRRFRLLGEYFFGENLSTFCGGINQGVNNVTHESIRDRGGWICLNSKLSDRLTNNIGCAIDQPFEDDLQGMAGARTCNKGIFTNFLYQWNKALMTGLEFGNWKTEYLDMAPGENLRSEFAAQYLF